MLILLEMLIMYLLVSSFLLCEIVDFIIIVKG